MNHSQSSGHSKNGKPGRGSLTGVCAAADAVLGQCADYIDRVSAEEYVYESMVVKGGTIGKHVRHILDHFRCAITSDGAEPIDYDHRTRGGSIESDQQAARSEIATLRGLLSDLGEHRLGETVTTRVMLCADGRTADLGSTRAREIFFAMHHAIHHNAILKAIGLELGFECPEGFGTAPSTINFEQAEAS